MFGLSNNPDVKSVSVYTTPGAALPKSWNASRVQLLPTWQSDDPISLIKTFLIMWAAAGKHDIVIYNIFPTCFGRGRLTNFIGLVLPGLLAAIAPTPVAVYMHNAPRTQDVVSLGYNPSRFTISLLDQILRFIAKRAHLFFPLESQSRALNESLGLATTALFIPYAEAIQILDAIQVPDLSEFRQTDRLPERPRGRLLVFGSWGPQKDISGLVRAIRGLESLGVDFEWVLAGSINPAFPATTSVLKAALAGLDRNRLSVRLNINDADLAQFLISSTVLFLPYRATGGASGVMNVAGFFDLPVVAFDLPQLRETASLVYPDTIFVSSSDMATAVGVLAKAVLDRSKARRTGPSDFARRSGTLVRAVDRLLKEVLGRPSTWNQDAR